MSGGVGKTSQPRQGALISSVPFPGANERMDPRGEQLGGRDAKRSKIKSRLQPTERGAAAFPSVWQRRHRSLQHTSPRRDRVRVIVGMVVTSHGTWCPHEKKVRESLARSQLTILVGQPKPRPSSSARTVHERGREGVREQRYCVCWGEVVRGVNFD